MWLWLGAPEARHRVSPRGHSKTLSLEMSWRCPGRAYMAEGSPGQWVGTVRGLLNPEGPMTFSS